jgi:hypothetical protein
VGSIRKGSFGSSSLARPAAACIHMHRAENNCGYCEPRSAKERRRNRLELQTHHASNVQTRVISSIAREEEGVPRVSPEVCEDRHGR